MRRLDRRLLVSFAGYAALFAYLALPWLRVAAHAIPRAFLVNPTDQLLVAWILAWVARALATQPLHVLDAPINHPAPAQLTTLEHFGSTQLLFAPVYWATGNAFLSTTVVAWLSYPLAALAMERLLLGLGTARAVAVTGALVFALGAERVPASLMVLKYANLYLPLVALAITRLRERPAARTTLALGFATALAVFSSYYLAVMVLVTAAVWSVGELARPGPGRLRFTLLGAAGMGSALLVLVLASVPYLGHGAGREMGAVVNAFARQQYRAHSGQLVLTLAALGAMAFGARSLGAQRAARHGLAITIVAQVLMLGSALPTATGPVTLPFALIAASPASFFRYPFRFIVVLGFGLALLVAAALEVVARRLGRIPGSIAVVAVAAALLITRGPQLAGSGFAECPAETDPIYDAVGEAARANGPGPMLELPIIPIVADRRREMGTEIESMIGATRHGLPLVAGYTDYPPPHRRLLASVLASLPRREALEDLIDMTHVRWILLRPVDEWPERVRPVRAGLLAPGLLKPVLERDGWQLLHVEREPRRSEWFAAIAAGPRPGLSILGTPLTAIPEIAARAQTVVHDLPARLSAGRLLMLEVQAWNLGAAPWPTAVAPRVPLAHTVRLLVRWTPLGTSGETSSEEEFGLLRDVPPGDTLRQQLLLRTPPEPGAYELEVRVRQVDGARFDGPGNVWHRQRVELLA